MLQFRRCVALAAVLFMSIVVYAQGIADSFYFVHFKSSDGLPHQQIQSMAFDHDGRLWIGTRNGLASYDGYTFKSYFNDPADENSLTHNFVQNVYVDDDDVLWVGTDKGICRYRRDTDDFRRYPDVDMRVHVVTGGKDNSIIAGGDYLLKYEPETDSFTRVRRQNNSFVLGIACSPAGEIYVSTHDAITVFDASMQRSSELDATKSVSGTDHISPLLFDSKGNLWIGLNGKGVLCYNKKTNSSTIYTVPRLTNGTIRAIAEDRIGRIWLGTEQGINIIDPETDNITHIRQDFVNPYRLNDNAIYCIVPDKNNNIWIGTYFGGINMIKNHANKFGWIAPGYDVWSLSGKTVRRIIEPEPGTLWLASEDGGINILDLESRRVSRFNAIPDIGPNVHELYSDSRRGCIWIGTFLRGLYRYDPRTGASRHYDIGRYANVDAHSVFSIASQPLPGSPAADRLWFCTSNGLFYYDSDTDSFKQTGHTILDSEFVYCIMADHAGNMWLGSVNHGLFRIDYATGKIESIGIAGPGEEDGLKDCYITALAEDSDNNLFIGTNNGGLYRMEKGNGRPKRLRDGTELGVICSMLKDSEGTLWMTTSNGLYKISPDGRAQYFSKNDGLPEAQFNFNSGLEASDGNIYMGTVNGLISFRPYITKEVRHPLKVHFGTLIVNAHEQRARTDRELQGVVLDAVDHIDLGYDESRQFTIRYGVIDPSAANTAVYQVMLKGVDSQWRDMGNLRSFTAIKLPPGSYELLVRACDAAGNWDDMPVSTLTINVARPFYASAWAFMIYILLALAAGFLLYRFFALRVREKQSIRKTQLDKEMGDELNRNKLEFFTNISHELKTPLSLILAPLRYLEESKDIDVESRKHLNLAISNTNKMVTLVDELVTFNRVENGNFQLYLQQGNPLLLVEQLTQNFYLAAEGRHQQLRVYTENNGEDVWYSSTCVELIVNNLLSNALKYTPEGGQIDVRASIIEEAPAPDATPEIYLAIEVRDTGIGITPEELGNIFRKYYQTRRGYTSAKQGWGIGLATVHKLVQLHKGIIAVESSMGAGSTFRVKLLVSETAFAPECYIASGKVVEEPRLQMIIPAAASSQLIHEYAKRDDRVNILLVEDNQELLFFLAETFNKSYNVFTASNGHEALKIASENNIDIVVSDVMMPEMDGIELCNTLKNDLSTSHIPVILLTAKNDQESMVAGYTGGAEAYVTKPFDPKILELRVKNILRARRQYVKDVMNDNAGKQSDNSDEIISMSKFDKEFISRINALIDKNMDNSEFSVADITTEFGISRSLLHVKMKTFANTSTIDYIRHRRMNLASSLLKQGYNDSETAYRTGYSDPNYFTKVFKKEFGITPSEFIAGLSATPPRQ